MTNQYSSRTLCGAYTVDGGEAARELLFSACRVRLVRIGDSRRSGRFSIVGGSEFVSSRYSYLSVVPAETGVMGLVPVDGGSDYSVKNVRIPDAYAQRLG